MIHTPVLTNEVLEYLNPKPNENFIDGTFDGGGHTTAILDKTKPKGKILGIELDRDLLQNVESQFEKVQLVGKLILVNGNFKNLKDILNANSIFKKGDKGQYDISGVLLDLGLSLWHLEKSHKGFSFSKNEILDMRYDREEKLNARDIINTWSEDKIEKIIREYGEEHHSEKIAREIIIERKKKPIITTFNLVEIIKRAVPWVHGKGMIRMLTRTFQSLRIAVNQEIENLKIVLPQIIDVTKCDGRIVIISFHSLEDRIVKFFFKEESKNNRIKILTKKPIRPTEEEIKLNPKAHSAKLRAAIKI